MLAIAAWEKGASREIDCRAIGGLGGCKRFAQGWRVRRTAATRPCTHRKSQVVPPATPRDEVNERPS